VAVPDVPAAQMRTANVATGPAKGWRVTLWIKEEALWHFRWQIVPPGRSRAFSNFRSLRRRAGDAVYAHIYTAVRPGLMRKMAKQRHTLVGAAARAAHKARVPIGEPAGQGPPARGPAAGGPRRRGGPPGRRDRRRPRARGRLPPSSGRLGPPALPTHSLAAEPQPFLRGQLMPSSHRLGPPAPGSLPSSRRPGRGGPAGSSRGARRSSAPRPVARRRRPGRASARGT